MMLSFGLFVCSIIAISTAFDFQGRENVKHRRSSDFPSSCGEALRRCELVNPQTFSPYKEDQIFLNFTIEANDRLCQLVGQVMNCSRYVESLPGCTGYLSGHVNVSLLDYFQLNLCTYPGRLDLDDIARCGNNPYIQKYFYGKYFEVVGRESGFRQCRQWSSANDRGGNLRKRDRLCRTVQGLVLSLPEVTRRYCGEHAAYAVMRAVLHLYKVQSLFHYIIGMRTCQFITEDIFLVSV